MAPIRIGFIGLSASGGWADRAHIPYLRQTARYKIVALCNSRVEAAQAAVKHFELPPSTKTYGSPSDLAADPDIDLVVSSVRVDRHYETIKPALEAGKDVYVEWPLAVNLEEAEELAAIARAKGVKTMVSLQGRQSPVVNKVKELVDSGRIGRVLSSTVVTSAGNFGASENVGVRYFNDKKIGGNMMSIHFGHPVDYVLYTLGELSSFTGLVSIQRPKVNIKGKDGKVLETMIKDTPDQILLQGTLKAGGVFSMHTRGGTPFKGQPGLYWRIYGETGEILTTADGSLIQVGYPNMNIQLHDHTKDETENVEWKGFMSGNVPEDLPMSAENVARLYEAFADGKTSGYVDFDEAVVRHRLLDQLYRSSESSSRLVSYL